MDVFDKLYEAELAKRKDKQQAQSTVQKLLTANQPEATPGDQALADMIRQAPSALGELDFTNPENLYSGATAHHWIPMAMQMGATAMGGPEAGLLMRGALSGLGAGAGYLYQSGAEPMMKGEAPTTTPGALAGNVGLGALLEPLMGLLGGGARGLSGKSTMLREGQAAGEEAGQAALADRTKLIQGQMLKNSEAALAGVKEDQVVKRVTEALAPHPPISQPTIESLTEQATPIRQSAQRNVASVFRGVGQKFDDHLEMYGELPVQGDYASAVEAQRALIANEKEPVSRKLSGIMDQLSSLDQNAPLNVDALPPILQQERTRLLRAHKQTPEEIDKYIQLAAQGMQSPSAAEAFTPTTVAKVDQVRKKLTGIVIGDGPPLDKRVANRLISSIDESFAGVLPPEAQARWTVLRNEWHEANNLFSPTFRSQLFKADSPEKVADVLMNSGGENANRVLTVIGKTPPDELPLLSSAFADKLTQGDVLKNVDKLDPRIFKALFKDTGFDTPQGWKDALSNKIDYQSVMANPVTAQAFNERFQAGMKSAGGKSYADAMDRAEQLLKNPGMAAGRAQTQGEIQNMTPFPVSKWVQHRIEFHTMLALTSLGSWAGAHFTAHPIAASLPLMYLGAGKAAAAILSNPTMGKLYYNALKSQNVEQAAFLLGRLAVAGLTEETRSAK